MFGKRITLFKLFGFEVRLDLSWIFIALLVTWSLARGLFPDYYKGLPPATYFWMGLFGALGLFASIIVHELFHSLVARKFGLHMKGITLFIFGGVAEMPGEPPSARAEFFIAIAGPIASIVLGFLFFLIHMGARAIGWPVSFVGVFGYLGGVNWFLAVLNLIPAFPLDGGRVLRSILWSRKKNLRWATRISSRIGAGFGLVLIFLGILNVVRTISAGGGVSIGGLWWIFIGIFLRNAAQMSYQNLITRRALEGEPVGHFMKAEPATVPPSISLKELVEEHIYKRHFKMFPVVEEGRLIGCISTREVKGIPREEWGRRTVGELLKPCSRENALTPAADAMKALSLMNQTGNSRLMVVEGDRLVGIVTLKDLLGFLSLKFDLEGEDFKGSLTIKKKI